MMVLTTDEDIFGNNIAMVEELATTKEVMVDVMMVVLIMYVIRTNTIIMKNANFRNLSF